MQSYGDNKPRKYNTYFDANNLYGLAMVQYLPYGKFKWLNNKIIDIISIGENSLRDYILEVDLEHLYELHELPNNYILGSEKFEISHYMLSKY